MIMNGEGGELVRGVTVPVITPLAPVGGTMRPDAAGLEKLYGAFAAAGIRRIMLLGSNGEGPLVPTQWLQPFVRDAVAAWHAYGPDHTIVVNVTAPGTAEVLLRAEAIADAGADGLVCSPPTYFRHRDDEVIKHFAAITALGRPVIIYNSPTYATPLTKGSLAGLLELPGIVGMKDSSGDPEQFRTMIDSAHAAGVGIAQGGETVALSALQSGADGIVLGIANLAPRPVAELWAAFRGGRTEDASTAQKLITELVGVHQIRRGVPTVKALLAARGVLPYEDSLPPLIACDADERRRLLDLVQPHDEALINSAA
ncbi:dihydrodipicolinate synthase family protein [Microlunatus parietis]|uniref:4-hydroxy-tetrahydrodipicolinate synthase n=1 Tax=Microlunatus parietis TaxID=682979 RepID=A0A7Y9I8R1_9ACTN|nr:dihydrodipicolinate synthase family protein [Microlunatus parietis]NYE72160.1 4-hydroxy-tetrahydrodipicolinate synthase [Microlunatus parietis]